MTQPAPCSHCAKLHWGTAANSTWRGLNGPVQLAEALQQHFLPAALTSPPASALAPAPACPALVACPAASARPPLAADSAEIEQHWLEWEEQEAWEAPAYTPEHHNTKSFNEHHNPSTPAPIKDTSAPAPPLLKGKPDSGDRLRLCAHRKPPEGEPKRPYGMAIRKPHSPACAGTNKLQAGVCYSGMTAEQQQGKWLCTHHMRSVCCLIECGRYAFHANPRPKGRQWPPPADRVQYTGEMSLWVPQQMALSNDSGSGSG